MKKLILMITLLLFSGPSLFAQTTALVSVGGDIMRGKEKARGDIERFEVGLVFGKQEFRLGPFFSGDWSYSYTVSKGYNGLYDRSRDLTLGLLFDSRKKGDVYFRDLRLNAGLRFSQNHNWDNTFESQQKNVIFCLSGNLKFNSSLQGWFGYDAIFFEVQEPIGKGSLDVGYNADTARNIELFNKEGFRIVGEIGIKQIPFFIGTRYFALNPFAHLGYGWETGTRKQLLELGAGTGFGYIDDDNCYNEVAKLEFFNRQDMNYARNRETFFPAGWFAKITFNVKVLIKK